MKTSYASRSLCLFGGPRHVRCPDCGCMGFKTELQFRTKKLGTRYRCGLPSCEARFRHTCVTE